MKREADTVIGICDVCHLKPANVYIAALSKRIHNIRADAGEKRLDKG